ncbi:electron transport complex subunit RsxD [Methylococcus geothermalis]|uniref:Ion-translocating oxidoreductase complex subunit D n=1 Tax=Methylococcus geothermalis TaxID=2681310 RepID=A0A858Q5J7_9GAMM|nr:electron transport complex subunit RsxD [Methylococcus geothermalis]QJD29101.1 electron transport complex subunit RsxD [Methylococcus geothermalis]
MRFNTAPAPHLAPTASTRRIMQWVLVAMAPGIAAQLWQFGPGVLINLALAIATALLTESAMLRLRAQPSRAGLSDWSAVLTAALLAVSLPPIAPWWISVFGALFAIVIGKQLYGGLGYNPFNPAMVGYAVLLISFPKPMTAWLPPTDLAATPLGLLDAWSAIAHRAGPAGSSFDALAMATPLDTLKTQLGLGRTMDEVQSGPLFGALAGKGWQWVNLGYLAGGLWLLRRGLIAWQIPAGFLAALGGLSLGFYLLEPQTYPTPLFHLFAGATMLGAFFIATDPVTASTTPKGRLIYGALIGGLVFVIRSWGGYPDGVAFAVLLLNLAAPTIDHYTRPRVYGHPG